MGAPLLSLRAWKFLPEMNINIIITIILIIFISCAIRYADSICSEQDRI